MHNKTPKSAMRRTLTKLGIASTVLAAAMPFASAQAAYPERPINLIVSYSPGGGTDLVARAIAPFLEKYLGGNASVVVANRPGAGGAIGFAEIARAKPDGYTIGFINTPNVVTIPIERDAGYQITDFDLIGNIIDDPGTFAVMANNKAGIKSLQQLVEYAKANPGDVTVGSTGIGSDDHLAMMIFEKITGTELMHVPYKGAANVRTAVMGNEIAVAASNIGEIKGYMAGGSDLIPLGTMSAQPSPLAPDVPTFREQGFDVISASLRGIAAPKGMPTEIRDKLVIAVKKSVDDPEFQELTSKIFAPVRYLAPVDYQKEVDGANTLFRQFWKENPWGEKK